MDIITKYFLDCVRWVGNLSAAQFNFFVRATLCFGLPTLACYAAFLHGSRSVLRQCLCLVLSILLAMFLPLGWIANLDPRLKTVLLALSLTLLAFLPTLLPVLLVPQLGLQRRLRLFGYLALGALFLLNLIYAGGGL